MYPYEPDNIYKQGKIYHFDIRTIDAGLARYLSENLKGSISNEMICVQTEVSEVKRRHISQIYTMTPAVMKSYKNGYWRSNMDIQKYAEILQKNLEKKYKQYMGEEKTMTVNMFCINNKYPIPIPYRGKDSSKSITFLTDRVTISVGDDPASQELAYMSLGTGIGSLNARGFGFVHGA
jgi:CRISPR-associated endoribonuclease Cas6